MKKTQKLLGVTLVLMLMLCFSMTAMADTMEDWSTDIAENYQAGDGSKDDPYQIETPQQLVLLAHNVTLGESYEGQYFVLNNDIDLGGKTWYLIGTYDQTAESMQKPFAGNFDGKGHIVKNLTVAVLGANSYAGLFGYNTGVIKNITVTGEVEGSNVGGIVGINKGNIENCINYATIKNNGYTSGARLSYAQGGIVGECSEGTIARCLNYGEVIPDKTDSGGIVGYIPNTASGKVRIEECGNYGNIQNNKKSTDRPMGGIVGSIMSNKTVIDSCFNAGDLVSDSANMGGLTANGNGTLIINSFNTGEIIRKNDNSTAKVGGLCGQAANIKNCYNIGDVYGQGYYSAVIMYSVSNFIIENSYYVEHPQLAPYGTTSSGAPTPNVIAKTKEGMQEQGFVDELNADSVRAFVADSGNINNGYPVLYWMSEIPSVPPAPTGIQGGEGKITGLDSEKAYEYRIKGEGQYTQVPAGSSEITGLAGTTYQLRYAGVEGGIPSAAVSVNVQGEISGIIQIGSQNSTVPQYGDTLCIQTAQQPRGAALTYQWYKGSSSDGNFTLIENVDGPTYKVQSEDIGSYLKVQVSAEGYSGSLTSAIKKVNKVGTTSLLRKCSGVGVSSENAADGKIIGLNPDVVYEYQIPGTTEYITLPIGTTEITDLDAGDYQIQCPATELQTASGPKKFTVYSAEAALSNAKNSAKSYLNTDLGRCQESEYTPENWTALNSAKTQGDSAIDEATSLEAVEEAKQAALANMAAVKTIRDTANYSAAQDVENKIAALPGIDSLTLNAKEDIEAARTAYNALTARQKLLVSSPLLEKLSDLEQAIKNLESDTEAAKKVSDQINALPAINALTLDNKEAVTEARSAYNGLTDTQKLLVSEDVLAKLTAAEAKINELENPKPINPDTPIIDVKVMTDVKESNWFYEDVAYVLAKGIMNGTSATTFDSNSNVTRGQFVTILGRWAGIKDAANSAPVDTKFTDVKSGTYYASHIAWASEKGITLGTTETTFEPNAQISRQDMATMIVRYAKVQGVTLSDADGSTFADDAQIRNYAKDAVYSLKASSILQGKGDNMFKPMDNATRAEAARIIRLLMEL